ncbi:MAG: SMC-Scp complex subunit ScpB [Candidatus Aenigmarchaeota archaeon ex4484_14]|nr:MAG: SMC-Scp complex subunit ScpB [Candidatus Aenigmarchaeota archaeon ex4484_14]
MNEKLALLEACLFTADKPLSIEELVKLLKTDKNEVKWLLKDLEEIYSKDEHGIMLSVVGGYQLVVKSKYLEKVSSLTSHTDLPRGILRVLSIIAFYEPIKQSEIAKVIGNRAYHYVAELEKRGLIKTEKHSRTKIIQTTKEFEEYFGVKKSALKKLLCEKNEKPKGDIEPRPKVSD